SGLVEPSDRRDPAKAGAVEAAVDGIAAALVAGGGHQAARLVEGQVAGGGRGRGPAVDGDPGAEDVHRVLRVAHHAAVDGHASGPDPALCFAARTEAAL